MGLYPSSSTERPKILFEFKKGRVSSEGIIIPTSVSEGEILLVKVGCGFEVRSFKMNDAPNNNRSISSFFIGINNDKYKIPGFLSWQYKRNSNESSSSAIPRLNVYAPPNRKDMRHPEVVSGFFPLC